jgi:BspA type Leucine rich repeat region (6 copies)
MNIAPLEWLTPRLGAACAMGAAVLWSILAGELQAQDFSYTNTNGTITITGYTGPGGNVVIPGTIDGLPVTSIGDGALSFINLSGQSNLTGLSNMTSVIISDSVTNLGEGAFAGCPNLTSISIGKGITRIKGGAGTPSWGTFQWCSSLTRVTIPDNVTNIGDGVGTRGGPFGAFSGCDSLTNFIVGKGLAYLGDGTFTYSTNLLSVYFKGNAPAFGASQSPAPTSPFFNSSNAIVYYLPGTSGWGPTYSGRPTMLWNPQVQTTDGSFGVVQNQFGFNIAGTPDIPLAIEASAALAAASWIPLQTCTLTNGLLYFSDPQWTNYSKRFYRIRSP